MKTIAIDDEPLALEVIKAHAAKVPWLQLEACFTDAFKALEYLQENSADLLLLDIKMPDINGLDLLSGLVKKPIVIFTIAYSEHAVKSFELDAVDYLLKPFSLARFVKACNKARELHLARHGKTDGDFCFIKSGYDQIRLYFDQILYIEAEGNYLNFITKDKKYLTRMTMAEAESMLPADLFLRVHRSFLVYIKHIEKIERTQIVIAGQPVPLGDAYKQALSKIY